MYDGCSLLKSEFIAIKTGNWECTICWNTEFTNLLLFIIILCLSWRSIRSIFALFSESSLRNWSVPLLDHFLMPRGSRSSSHDFQKSDLWRLCVFLSFYWFLELERNDLYACSLFWYHWWNYLAEIHLQTKWFLTAQYIFFNCLLRLATMHKWYKWH